MFQKAKIAPSILSADFNELGKALSDIACAGADWAHVDVMDGHFVPNLTLGVPFVASATRKGVLPLDVHLMIDNPLDQLPWFLEYAPYMVTMHVEALRSESDARKAASMIHDAGSHAGIAINPETPVDSVYATLDCWDMVLVMSVHPGFSGQSYIEGSDVKVASLAQRIRSDRRLGAAPRIEVDGGMNDTTAAAVCAQGADVVVSGSTIFNATNMAKAISDLRSVADGSHE